jgi:hypothetical protein
VFKEQGSAGAGGLQHCYRTAGTSTLLWTREFHT